MAFNAKTSANLISARKLPDVVDRAVKLAAERVGPLDAAENHYVPKWDLIGRRLRNAALADRFATEVTAQISASGFKVEPAVFKVGGITIAGFIERDLLPQLRGF